MILKEKKSPLKVTMNNKKSFYITTTLPYVNAPLHMGHALEFVRADTIARLKKLQGFDVYFNTGSDEHGIKIYEKATEKKISVQDFVDQGFETFKEQLKIFGVSEDIHFVRTTSADHQYAAQSFWKLVYDNNFIYKKNYEAKYCAGCESEKTDSELVNGECPCHPGMKLKIINEENYFFKYSAFTDKLLKFYEENPNFIVPEFRFNEIKNFVKNGLQDFSISRLKEKMPWGIPVPGDDTQVMYVWFDALVNYISTLGWPKNSENFEKYWKNGTPTQYCGKDNTRFQGAMWQVMLFSAGLPNSHQIIVNGFITGDGGVRMSKTLGNIVDPRDIVSEYGTDALRYFLLREVSSFEDSPFTIERFKDAYNAGLANGLGNLVSRIMTMAVNYGVKLNEEEMKIDYFAEKKESLEKYDINKFINWIWECLGALDQYIQKNEPFKKIKVDKKGAEKDVHYLLLHLYKASLAIEPMLPETSQKIQKLIRENKKPEAPLFLRK
ncbi:MAG TPA: methionine--tRNA ligase [Candidatus Paceibacterota bacterium]|mgnify:CR=1 FL=1|nr:methionine--tRNA ligase [Candidatus Paceibacterota bacterium]HPT18079.1 methionine--tRNA ligase [Candidatus Paceibacterota bacterium]